MERYALWRSPLTLYERYAQFDRTAEHEALEVAIRQYLKKGGKIIMLPPEVVKENNMVGADKSCYETIYGGLWA